SPKPVRTDDSVICSSLPSDDADFREIIDEFVQRLHEQLGQMQSAYESRELSQVASLAHWLKGSGGTAGFDAFTVPARKLEESAKAGSLEEIEASIAELRELTSRVYVPSQPASLE